MNTSFSGNQVQAPDGKGLSDKAHAFERLDIP